jgi:hypothetical protein
MKVQGKQCIRTLEGYIIPLDIINGLPYLKMCPPTRQEIDDLPHVILTPATSWNPKILDLMLSDEPDWYDTLKEWDEGKITSPFDQYGNYRHREVAHAPLVVPEIEEPDDELEVQFHVASNLNIQYVALENQTKPTPIDYEKYRPQFLHVSVEKVRKTFQSTTQMATNIMSGRRVEQTSNSPYPAHNVLRRNEPVASDTIFSDVSAVDTNQHTMAQI